MLARNLHFRLAHARVISCLDRSSPCSTVETPLKALKADEMLLIAVLGQLLLAILGAFAEPGAPEWRPAEAVRSPR